MSISNEIHFCQVCRDEIIAIMTLIDMRTKVCSGTCLSKFLNGKENFKVIKFPLNKDRFSVTPLNRVNSLNLHEYIQKKVSDGQNHT